MNGTTRNGAHDRLEAIHDNPESEARAHKAQGGAVVGYIGGTVPVELIAASGAFPVRLKGGPEIPTPNADRYMEPVREAYLQRILERLLMGEYQDFDLIVVPHASEGLLQFYYLIEHVRAVEPDLRLPKVVLLDILQTPFDYTTHYDRDRLAELRQTLSDIAGPFSDAAIAEAIDRRNEAREMFRQVVSAQGVPGSFRLKLAAAGQVLRVEDFVSLMRGLQVAGGRASAPAVAVTGSPQEGTGLYNHIESRGFAVVGEDHDWGERLYAIDVEPRDDPLLALAAHYQAYGVGPRRMEPEPPEVTLSGRRPDALIAYYERDDDTLGWDFPGHRSRAMKAGIATLLVRGGSDGGLAEGETARLDDFLAGIARPTAEAQDR